ncbi:ATP-binding protein [Kibdelosporangium phytohabitans]|uniref:ATP-binding protein n=1 Tax=Kibdelosporangium phytohabitans TaxID=860235 RepID=UPI0019F6AD9D|nr:ATP-binding protein [Kibdelosporangium phytohabitans]MBE1463224.1 anti-sigma regulatory factor (Ser/Thr protein kinase) [Kibdelosporangium phytohabitans]
MTTHLHVDHESAVHVAARTARTVAQEVGLPSPLPDRAAVIASELTSNLHKHAGGGNVFIQPLLTGTGVEVVATDSGPGMADPDRCLTDGHTTTGTLGVGLGAVRRMASDFSVHSTVHHGTLLAARLLAPGSAAEAHRRIGYLCVPADGQQVSGDNAAVHTDTSSAAAATTVLVADGLGHGPEAAEASQAAVRIFQRDPTLPLPELLTAMHHGLRLTRGAAIAVTRIVDRNAQFCGVGNVRCSVLSPDGHQALLSKPGVVGARSITPQVRSVPLAEHSTVVVHTDGLQPHWPVHTAPIRLGLASALLAAGLVHDHRLAHDDATVVVIR